MINSDGHFYFPINLACFNRAKLMQSSWFVQIKLRKNRLNFYACAVEPDKGNIEPQCKKQPDEVGVVQRGGKFVDLSKAPDHAPDCPGQEKQHGDAGSRVAEIKEAETPDHLKEQLAEKQPSGFKRFGGAWFAENKIIGESHKQIQEKIPQVSISNMGRNRFPVIVRE